MIFFSANHGQKAIRTKKFRAALIDQKIKKFTTAKAGQTRRACIQKQLRVQNSLKDDFFNR